MSENNYAPKNKYLWDPWFIVVDEEVHMFHLQADRTGDADGRHNNNVSIGHAISKDLKTWETQPTALIPGNPGTWDDVSLWTGSVFTEDSTHYLFYTGRNNEQIWVQKIGMATSPDLKFWKKNKENPILEADNTLYKMNNEKNSLGVVPAFRDPFIYKEGQYYFAFITARDNSLAETYNGCIALARSKDLLSWELLPPALSPGHYDEMEVPQVILHTGKYYLFFMANPKFYEPTWAAKVGTAHGLHCYVADSLQGTYKPVNNGTGIVFDNPKLLGLRLIRKNEDGYDALGWLNEGSDGELIAKLSELKKIEIDGDTVTVQ